jgi:hypothetical protein
MVVLMLRLMDFLELVWLHFVNLSTLGEQEGVADACQVHRYHALFLAHVRERNRLVFLDGCVVEGFGLCLCLTDLQMDPKLLFFWDSVRTGAFLILHLLVLERHGHREFKRLFDELDLADLSAGLGLLSDDLE